MATEIKAYYKTENYDTYQMLIATCQATDKCGFTYGRQLLGTLLFFVPREWGSTVRLSGSFL